MLSYKLIHDLYTYDNMCAIIIQAKIQNEE